MAPAKNDNNKSLTLPLAGKILRIPNLRPRYRDWPQGISPHLEKARHMTDAMIERAVPNEKERDFLKSQDIGLACAMIHPNGEWPEIQVIVSYMAWIDLFDDEVDQAHTEIATSKIKTEDYCTRSLSYIKAVLGLDTPKQVDAPFACMSFFNAYGGPLAESASPELKIRVFREFERYMSQIMIEQGRHYDKIVPSPEEYLNTRVRSTIANSAFVVAAEFFTRVRLPKWVTDSEEMDIILTETDRHVVLINDLYSMKKEMAFGTASNLVAVLFLSNPSKCLDDVVNKILKMLDTSRQLFEDAFSTLDKRTKSDPTLNADMRLCVDFARTEVTAVLEWSLVTERYQAARHLQEDGSVEFYL